MAKFRDPRFFYSDECKSFEYGKYGPSEFAIVFKHANGDFRLKTYTRNWFRNVLKNQFTSYEEACLFAVMSGLQVKPKSEFTVVRKSLIDEWHRPHMRNVWLLKSEQS